MENKSYESPYKRTKLQRFKDKSKYFKQLASEYKEAYEEAQYKLDFYDYINERAMKLGIEVSFNRIKEIYQQANTYLFEGLDNTESTNTEEE